MTKILIANSLRSGNKPLSALIKALIGRFDLAVWAADSFFVDRFPGAKKSYFGPPAAGAGSVLFILFCVFSWPVYFFLILWQRIRKQIAAVVCLGKNEKILLTLPARLCGAKVLWLEGVEERYHKFSPTTWLLIVFSRLAQVVVFTSSSAQNLSISGFKAKNIVNLSLGVDLDYAHQDNLFSELAVSDKPYRFFKNFSIGTVVDFGDRGQFENLLKAIKSCSNIIPNIQLVVIGASRERRNLNWLSKKLGIEKLVWFVGEQDDLVKWFDSFDLYFSLASNPNLFDLETALLAMSRGVPAVVFRHPAFADFISEGETGFIAEAGDVEALTRKLIDIEPDKKLLKRVGANSQNLVFQNFGRRQQAELLVKLIE